MDLLLRFFIGGVVVSVFAILADLLKPKSFAGLFGAAPSVALATLALTVSRNGVEYASTESRSMLAGAIALGFYALVVCRLLLRQRLQPLAATLRSIGIWFLAAFGLWFGFLR